MSVWWRLYGTGFRNSTVGSKKIRSHPDEARDDRGVFVGKGLKGQTSPGVEPLECGIEHSHDRLDCDRDVERWAKRTFRHAFFDHFRPQVLVVPPHLVGS